MYKTYGTSILDYVIRDGHVSVDKYNIVLYCNVDKRKVLNKNSAIIPIYGTSKAFFSCGAIVHVSSTFLCIMRIHSISIHHIAALFMNMIVK